MLYYQTVSVDTFKHCVIKSCYYPIVGNINNFESRGYLSNRPTQREIVRFSQRQPSYIFFVYNKRGRLKYRITFEQDLEAGESTFTFFARRGSKTKRGETYQSQMKGDITQLRAKEILVNAQDEDGKYVQKVDPTSDDLWYTSFKDTSAAIVKPRKAFQRGKDRDHKAGRARGKVVLIYADRSYIIIPFRAVLLEAERLVNRKKLYE